MFVIFEEDKNDVISSILNEVQYRIELIKVIIDQNNIGGRVLLLSCSSSESLVTLQLNLQLVEILQLRLQLHMQNNYICNTPIKIASKYAA